MKKLIFILGNNAFFAQSSNRVPKAIVEKRFFPTIKIKPIKAGPKIQIDHCQLIIWTAQMAHSGRSEILDGFDPQDTLGRSVDNPIDAVAPPRRLRSATEPSRLRRRLCAERPAAALLAARAAGLGCGRNWTKSWYKKTVRRYTKMQREIDRSRGRCSELLRRRQAKITKDRERREEKRSGNSAERKAEKQVSEPLFTSEKVIAAPEVTATESPPADQRGQQVDGPPQNNAVPVAKDVDSEPAIETEPEKHQPLPELPPASGSVKKRRAELQTMEPPAKKGRSGWNVCSIQ
jgi:hypothetical protein